MIKVIQIGFGPLGVQTAKFIAKKSTIKTVAVVDNDPDLYNKNINDLNLFVRRSFSNHLWSWMNDSARFI